MNKCFQHHGNMSLWATESRNAVKENRSQKWDVAKQHSLLNIEKLGKGKQQSLLKPHFDYIHKKLIDENIFSHIGFRFGLASRTHTRHC
jgi:hypothetical protein